MRYVSIKRSRPFADGRETARAFLCEKDRKMEECTSIRHVSSRQPVVITGAHHSGKSYVLNRLHADAGEQRHRRLAGRDAALRGQRFPARALLVLRKAEAELAGIAERRPVDAAGLAAADVADG